MVEKKPKVTKIKKIPSLAVKKPLITAEGWKRLFAPQVKPKKKKK